MTPAAASHLTVLSKRAIAATCAALPARYPISRSDARGIGLSDAEWDALERVPNNPWMRVYCPRVRRAVAAPAA